jgi:hypothetical protein
MNTPRGTLGSVVGATILFLAATLLWAGGRREQPAPEVPAPRTEPVRIFLAYPDDQVPERMVRERFDLPPAAALAKWTTFVVDAEGRLRYEAGGQYSGIRQTALREEQGWRLFEYAYARRDSPPPPDRTYELRFRLSDLVEGERLDQPARYAVQRAIVESGKSRGRVRLLSVEYQGRGRFAAVVGLLD